MQTELDSLGYRWIDNWAVIPDTPSGNVNGRTHGVCVTQDQSVIVFHQAHDAVLRFDREGGLISSWGGERYMHAHGLTYMAESGTEYLWLTDERSGEVVKATLDGEVVQSVSQPNAPVFVGDDASSYSPTWVAQNPCNGEIWVADGYGSSCLYCYDKDGHYLRHLNGEEGAGRFKCPHGIAFSTYNELWVADRGNQRIAVLSAQGEYLRHYDHVTHSPCMFAFRDKQVLIPELFTGVKLLDYECKVHASLGDNRTVRLDENMQKDCPDGWPNLAGTDYIKPGRFNSPHAACFAPNGDIYVVEWVMGGRITKLEKL